MPHIKRKSNFSFKKRTRPAPRNQKLNKIERKQVKKMIIGSAEKKFIAQTIVNTAALPSGTLGKLNYDPVGGVGLPPQGTGDHDRVGDEILWDSLEMRLYPDLDTSATQNHYSRFIFFQWHQIDTTIPQIADILLLDSSGAPDYNSTYNEDTRPNYTILYDRTFCHNVSGNSIYFIRKFIDIKRKRVRFQTGSGANNSSNCIYYIIIGSGNSSTETAYIFSECKLKYTDV